MSTDPLVLSQCAVRLGKTDILFDATLRVHPGEIVGLVGENGSGKTTVIRVAVGLIRPQSGTVQLFGGDPRARANLRRVGAAIDTPALYPWMSGKAALRTLLHLSGEADRGQVAQALARFHLARVGRKPIIRYSQGMKKRLVLAAASLSDPTLLMLDEPTNGLDPDGRKLVMAWLNDHRDAGSSALIATHRLDEISLCDRLIAVADGQTTETTRAAWTEQMGLRA